jgi:F420-dependent oxidoreductase-like protein
VWAVWAAEAWSSDAISPLAYLAAKTERIRLGTGILQISARAPSMIAMTALTMAQLSHDRFLLGLGVSGPQVVEGLHGVSFARPVARLRETLEIVRLGLAGFKLEHSGDLFQLPLPGGEGKALRIDLPPRPHLPIYLATLGPRSLELTGEVADGWLGASFLPERADVFLEPLRRGAEAAGRSLDELDLEVTVDVEIGGDVERMVDDRRARMAFVLGGMGSPRRNFYNEAFCRAGWEADARRVQRLWVEGHRDEAAAAVPAELILGNHLIGDEARIRERLALYHRAGITTLRVNPGGRNAGERLATLARLHELIGEAGLGDPA